MKSYRSTFTAGLVVAATMYAAVLFAPMDAAEAGSLNASSPAQATTAPRPFIRIADGPSCTQKQGRCEDKCMSAGGGSAATTQCFHKCQAEADACK